MRGYAVPRLWPGETFVCVASGPSLTRDDVECVRGKARVIAVNSSYKMAPWCDVLYACDSRWWTWLHRGVPGFEDGPEFVRSFTGLKFTLQSPVWQGVRLLKNTGAMGLERKPTGLRTGRNSGYQAINLAVHLGAARILLLGYDMQRLNGEDHWHGSHPMRGNIPYSSFLQHYLTLVDPLRKAGVEVINCTRRTALTCFPVMSLDEALAGMETAA